ncbi:hypothetical protein, partial [Rathayibacter sp. AY1F7]|uniref:hypothetical protein n=1 Tax=Rathayibacter sp. AY1F7 TaxID=2080561 RepID=UPI0035BE68F5
GAGVGVVASGGLTALARQTRRVDARSTSGIGTSTRSPGAPLSSSSTARRPISSCGSATVVSPGRR